MKTLYLDCLSGVAGDMIVGALVDLGVDQSVFRSAVSTLGLPDVELRFEREKRQEIEGCKFRVLVGGKPADADEQHNSQHSHDHAHGSHSHDHDHGHGDKHSHGHAHDRHHGAHDHSHGRNHREIRELIGNSGLDEQVKVRAMSVFRRIAIAEGKIHGMPPEDVHFHEVGGEDAIADIVCACAGIQALDIESVVCSRLFEGTGWIRCAHGRFPLPAPATAEILKGIPLRQIDLPFEFVTPTGAAILAEFVSNFTTMPEMAVSQIGYGIGTRTLEDRPNVLRALVGDTKSEETLSDLKTDRVVQIETNIDDMSAELAADVINRLFAAGALDAWITPIQMKKGRPGFLMGVLTRENEESIAIDILLEHSSAFGVRFTRYERRVFARDFIDVQTPHGMVRVKLALRNGTVVKIAPEFESCRRISEQADLPIREVMNAAIAAYQALGG